MASNMSSGTCTYHSHETMFFPNMVSTNRTIFQSIVGIENRFTNPSMAAARRYEELPMGNNTTSGCLHSIRPDPASAQFTSNQRVPATSAYDNSTHQRPMEVDINYDYLFHLAVASVGVNSPRQRYFPNLRQNIEHPSISVEITAHTCPVSSRDTRFPHTRREPQPTETYFSPSNATASLVENDWSTSASNLVSATNNAAAEISMLPSDAAVNVNTSSAPSAEYTRQVLNTLGLNEVALHAYLSQLVLTESKRIHFGYPYKTDKGVFYLSCNRSQKDKFTSRQILRSIEAEDDLIDHSNQSTIVYEATDLFLDQNQTCLRCGSNFIPRQYYCQNSDRCSLSLPVEDSMWPSLGKHVFIENNPLNGPYQDYVVTTPRVNGNPSVYAVDCEMVYTTRGFELGRVTIVCGANGEVVLDTYVHPRGNVTCFNEKFSGVNPTRLLNAISFEDARRRFIEIVKQDDILLGHALNNDLRVLRVIHRRVVDTSVIFMSDSGLRRRLRDLVAQYLPYTIQKVGSHSSEMDARAALDLLLSRARHQHLQTSTF